MEATSPCQWRMECCPLAPVRIRWGALAFDDLPSLGPTLHRLGQAPQGMLMGSQGSIPGSQSPEGFRGPGLEVVYVDHSCSRSVDQNLEEPEILAMQTAPCPGRGGVQDCGAQPAASGTSPVGEIGVQRLTGSCLLHEGHSWAKDESICRKHLAQRNFFLKIRGYRL